jgi:hypothetical protein
MQSIRTAIEQASNYLVEHPEAARASDAAATAACEDGLRFRIEGPWSPLTSDMSKSVGGDASAPSPGWLLRAAWGALTRSHAAAASYSWMRPPSRSRRRTAVDAGSPRVEGILSGSGA